MSADGHADVRNEGELPPLGDQLITTEEVAQMLTLSTRQARRLIVGEAFGRPVRAGRGLLVDRDEVAAHLSRKDAS